MLTAATRQLDRLAAPEEALATLLTAPDRAWRDPRLPALAHRAIKAGADGLAFLEALAPPALARVDPHSDLARDLARATARRDLARAAVDAERQQLAQKTGAARLHLPRALVAVHPPLGAADRSFAAAHARDADDAIDAIDAGHAIGAGDAIEAGNAIGAGDAIDVSHAVDGSHAIDAGDAIIDADAIDAIDAPHVTTEHGTEPATTPDPATEATPRPAPTHRLRLAGARAIAERLAPELRADPPTALRLAEWFEAHAAYPQAAESYQAALADPHQLGAWHGTARHLARAGRWRPLAAHLDAMSRAPLPRAHRVEALGELGHLLRTRLDAPAEADAVAHRIVLLTRPVWPRVLLAIAFLLTLALFAAVAYDLMRMHLP